MLTTIAVVQFEIQQGMPEENLAKAEQFMREAASEADLIVFPEDFVTGPLNGDATLVDYDKRYTQHFQQLARAYSIDIVPGSIIEGERSGTGLYNTTCYIDKTGEVKGSYRKVNLWHPERDYLARGNEFPVFDTQYGRVGLIICWDLMFPEAFRAMLRRGVEIVICPSYWCFEDAGVGLAHDVNAEVKLVNALCIARAFENEIILVYANAAGGATVRQGEEQLIGRSQITVPFKGALHILQHTHEEMFLQTVDTTLLKDAELAYRIRKDMQAGLLS